MKPFVGARYTTEWGTCWVKSIWASGFLELHFYNGNPSKLVNTDYPELYSWPLLNEKEHLIGKFNKYVAESEENINS